jgi:hypothetical protein
VSGELTAGDDAEEAAWFRVEDLAELHLAKETEEVILEGFKVAGQGKAAGPSQP